MKLFNHNDTIRHGCLITLPICFSSRIIESHPLIQIDVLLLRCFMLALLKASVTIVAGFCPEFHPPFLWRSKHQTRNDCSYQ